MELALSLSAGAVLLSVAAFYQTHLKRFMLEFAFGDAWARSERYEPGIDYDSPAKVVFRVPVAVTNHGAKSGFLIRLWLEGDEGTHIEHARRLATDGSSQPWIPIAVAPKGTVSFEAEFAASRLGGNPFTDGKQACILCAETSRASRIALLKLAFSFGDDEFKQACEIGLDYPQLSQLRLDRATPR